jgi:5'-3' exonuclease
MVLIDFSSIIHRMIHTSVANIKPTKVDGKYITKDFIGLTKYYIFQELFSIKQEHGANFGDLVICLDKSADGYWRKDVYPGYKAGRKKGREESEINFREVFAEIDGMIEQIKLNLPWKVIEVPRAEADDIMLVLAQEFNKYEKILIHSPDKDMIQAQRDNDTVFQYSSLTKKWIVPENKHDHMDHWVMEHVCLGDASDEVPKVVDHTEFSKSFLDYLKAEGYTIETPMDFKAATIPNEEKQRLIEEFDVYKLNRKKESTGIKDIYKDIKFGPATLKKKVAEFGSLDAWLDSHPLYRSHYERNFTLVMTEGIPTNIWNEIILSYKEALVEYNDKEFEEYLIENELKSILMDLPSIFKIQRELTAEDFGW